MNRKIAVRGDNKLNPVLKAQIQTLRGGMANIAEQQPMPARFTAETDPNMPAMIITDLLTGRQTTVGMFAYRAVRSALSDLFAPL